LVLPRQGRACATRLWTGYKSSFHSSKITTNTIAEMIHAKINLPDVFNVFTHHLSPAIAGS
jgi:hypothetical protein